MDLLRKLYAQLKRFKYRRLVVLLATIVVFVTTYALVLPAITLEQSKVSQQEGIHLADTETSSATSSETGAEGTEETQPVQTSQIEDTSPLTTVDTTAPTTADSKAPTQDVTEDTAQPSGEPTISEGGELTYKGEGLEVVAHFNKEAQLPVGTVLAVKEIKPNSKEHQLYLEKTQQSLAEDTLGQARFYDISLVKDGQAIQPAQPIKIELKYQQKIRLPEEQALMAVHFSDHQTKPSEFLKVDAIEQNQEVSKVQFEANSFSVYGLLSADARTVRRITIGEQEYYSVKFVYQDNQGQEQEISNLVGVTENAQIGQLPQAPFKEGYRFDGWKDRATGQMVTADTIVRNDMVVDAQFSPITIYTVKTHYFYQNSQSNQEVTFDTDIFQLEEGDLPYQITPPASTKIAGGAGLTPDVTYYTDRSQISLNQGDLKRLDEEDGTADRQITLRVQYRPANATFTYVYKIKDLQGTGYTEFHRVNGYGLVGNRAEPQILSFHFAEFERAESITLSGQPNQELVLYYRRLEKKLTYHPNGGSYIPPVTALYGSMVAISSLKPVKPGYEFVSWHEKPDLSDPAKQGQIQLNEDTTLYAKWQRKKVNYNIVYFVEQYSNKSRTAYPVYYQTNSAQAFVGDTIEATKAATLSNVPFYYELDWERNRQSRVVVTEDGTASLAVYYKLKRYTFIFDLNDPRAFSSNPSVRDYRDWTIGLGRIQMNGKVYKNKEYRLTDVVYGQNVASVWPSSLSNPKEIYFEGNPLVPTHGSKWYFMGWRNDANTSNFVTKRFEVTEDMLIGADSNNEKVYSARYHYNAIDYRVEYWLQDPNDPSKYSSDPRFAQGYAYSKGIDLTQKDIYGFSKYEGTPPGHQPTYVGSNGYKLFRLYYNRNTYKIDYIYGGQVIKTIANIPFNSDISHPSYSVEPNRPPGVDSDYIWRGWYSDATLRNPARFEVMFGQNIAVYAKWDKPNYSVTFDNNGGNGTVFPTKTVAKYEKVFNPGAPTRANHQFLGWYTERIGGQEFDWNQPITKHTTLYARWKPLPVTYRVRYLDATTSSPLSADLLVESPNLAAGQQIQVTAKAIPGYLPNALTQTKQLEYGENVVTFYYSPHNQKVAYTVRYVLASNESIEVAPTRQLEAQAGIILAKEKAVQVDKEHLRKQAGVTENMLANDYYALEDVQKIFFTSDVQKNVLTFRYSDYDTAHIKVNFLDMDGNPIPGMESLRESRKRPSAYIVPRPTIEGYTYHHSIDNHRAENQLYYRITQSQELEINLYYQKNLFIRAADKQKVYDGQTLTSSGLTDIARIDGLNSGDRLTAISYEGRQSDAGTSPTLPRDAIIQRASASSKLSPDYYKITYQSGNLLVTKQPVTVTVTGQEVTKVYDGQNEQVGYDMAISDTSGLYQENFVQFTGLASERTIRQKNAGVYTLELQNRFRNTNQNFDVRFTIKNGSLTIQPRRLTFTSASANQGYDGLELRAEEVVITAPAGAGYSGLVAGDQVDFRILGSQIQPGVSENTFAYDFVNGTLAQNYDITLQTGQLTVYPTLNLQKTSHHWTPLSGGKFELTKWDGSHWSAVHTVPSIEIQSEKGSNLVGLMPGLYKLSELAAPDGYIVLNDAIYFTVKQEGVHFHLTLTDQTGQVAQPEQAHFVNQDGGASLGMGELIPFSHRLQVANRPGTALPETGGLGTTLFIFSGLGLISTALFGLNRQRKRLKNQ